MAPGDDATAGFNRRVIALSRATGNILDFPPKITSIHLRLRGTANIFEVAKTKLFGRSHYPFESIDI
jgi:hypothetical protein